MTVAMCRVRCHPSRGCDILCDTKQLDCCHCVEAEGVYDSGVKACLVTLWFAPASPWDQGIAVIVSLLPVCDVSPCSVQSLSGTRRVLLILLESCQQTDVHVIAMVS